MDPYRPPQEVDPFENYDELETGGGFLLPPDIQELCKKLGKYLSEIGLLMILASIFSGLSLLVTGGFAFDQGGNVDAMGNSVAVNLINQLINVVLLFLIGRYMRSASKSFKKLAQTKSQHNVTVMEGMQRLKSLYTVECVYIGLGIFMVVLNQAIILAF